MKELFGGDRKYGIIGTLLVHGIVLIILLLFGFSAPPIEFPEPDGILVDFGELVVGDNDGAASEPVAVNPSAPSQNQSVDDAIVTQEETPSISIKKNKTKVDETPKQPELTPEEQERIRQEAEFKQKMDALTGRLSQGGGTGTEGTAGNSSTGAESGKPGNPNGTSAKNTKGNPGTPYGNGDAVSLVKPTNTQNCDNPIVLTVTVNSDGKVMDIKKVETALSEQSCIEAAKAAARKTIFQPDSREVRYAKITYEYTMSK
ncbi:MAG: hypothetical protein MJ198_02570 [Bacteroidales bacterium]|nr:hypothetical protein [Bacteroidales bacterium]